MVLTFPVAVGFELAKKALCTVLLNKYRGMKKKNACKLARDYDLRCVTCITVAFKRTL